MSLGLFLILFAFIIIIYVIIFERHKKGKKLEYFFDFIILLAISGVLLAKYIPSSFHNNSNKYLNFCYKAQMILGNAIARYNSENKEKIFPENCNNSEIEKYQKELLLNNIYLKEQVYPTRYCSFQIQDSELFCLEHGSCNSNSKFFTNGFPVKGFEKQNKDNEQLRNNIKEMNKKEKERNYSLIVSIFGFAAALKFFIFIFL